ncbi:hypothetical protein [Marilutibacter maris]|uniref:hypothetical protein n=1 Tax=Marilutibacter maris TaxID=1605891 RepID=UPI0011AE7EAB|nr:hypothetical protein [Lysobacter maris]
MNKNLRSDITLSVNRALLGEVFCELVAVSCKTEGESRFELIFYVDSAPSDSMEEDVSCVETEVMADFPASFEISHKVVQFEQSHLNASDVFWIFLRKQG